MLLTIYRRHSRTCKHRSEGRDYRRCACPIWIDGTVEDREFRKSLATSDWIAASKEKAAIEAELEKPRDTRTTIAEAGEKFIADGGRGRRLADATVKKYELLFSRLDSFAAARGIKFLGELDVDALTTFRAQWKCGPLTASKTLERLRAFLGFALERKWISENPARKLKATKIPDRPTLPYTQDEMIRILAALDVYAQKAGARNAQRLRAFILTMRYSGMRVGDVTTLRVDRVVGNKLLVYTAKTGTPVHCVLPDFVVAALAASPRSSSEYYFQTGQASAHTATGKWQFRLRRLFKLAKIPSGHAHRFRDTFAVELLLAGVPIERVSVLLGHRTTRITEKHYSPWCKSRQDQLEQDLARAWSADPIALLERKGRAAGARVN
jgi:integrase